MTTTGVDVHDCVSDIKFDHGDPSGECDVYGVTEMIILISKNEDGFPSFKSS
jgi:hypothetical protein